MAFEDNREFIAVLEKSGDIVHIKQEVDWELEVGAILRRANELHSPAVLFEKIKDYPKGYRIFGSPLSTHRRLAIAMGLEPETSVKDLQMEYGRRILRPVKPIIAKDAPCKENIIIGDEVDLYRFPVPMIHEGDGARFIGTWHLGICRDPDSDWTNWGMYRQMILNRRYIAGQCDIFSDQGRIFYEKYAPKNQNMPLAVAIGADPICDLVSAASFRIGESEVDYAGALRGKPVELVKCETNDLLVPAHAEIILEGELLPGVIVDEGPFGEFTGYRSPPSRQPLFRVHAITHRNNPILSVTCMGIPPDESSLLKGIDSAVQVKRLLDQYGITYTDVYIPAEAAHHLVIIGLKKIHDYDVARVYNAVCLYGRVATMIVVDDDIDVFNLDEVLHAFATKCHPVRNIRVREQERVISLTPYLSDKEITARTGPKVLFDCTWPLEWPKETRVPRRMSFKGAYPEGIRQKVIEHWADYGFK